MAHKLGFTPVDAQTELRPGLVIHRVAKGSERYLRITHVFERSLYVMPVSTAEEARNARRPVKLRISEILAELRFTGKAKATLGKLPLPSELSQAVGLPETQEIKATMGIIEPLLATFQVEDNLSRWEFTSRIEQRAASLSISKTTVKRILLRYYYFGGIREAVGPLRPGPNVAELSAPSPEAVVDSDTPSKGRPGPVSRVAKKLGVKNKFMPTEADYADMLAAMLRCHSEGKTAWVDIHPSYLETEFAQRHPEVYKLLRAGKIDKPVTLRQFTLAIRKYQQFADDVLKHFPQLAARKRSGSLVAAGPGEIYELDATGGRVFIVDSKKPFGVLGKPTIYLLIDRWSRFVVSVYITFDSASYEALRYALLIAFTSRTKRFKNLGIEVDDEEWPVGVVPAQIARDRGPADMMADATTESLVKALHIDLLTMPPYCPDGKGIIERFIRELKHLMKQRGIAGVYADRPMERESKKRAMKAEVAAAHTLQQIYRVLVEIVKTYNKKPHRTLKAMGILKLNRVTPCPQDAYLWGLKHLTGIKRPPLTDDDYLRIFRGREKATIKNGVVTYRGRKYHPENAAATRQASASNSKVRAIEVAVDRSYPVDLYVPGGDGTWPLWVVDNTGLRTWQEITMEEEDGLAEASKTLIAAADHAHFVSGLGGSKKPPKVVADRSDEHTTGVVSNSEAPADVKSRRSAQSDAIKRGLSGRDPISRPVRAAVQPKKETWQQVEERERQAVIERQRQGSKK